MLIKDRHQRYDSTTLKVNLDKITDLEKITGMAEITYKVSSHLKLYRI